MYCIEPGCVAAASQPKHGSIGFELYCGNVLPTEVQVPAYWNKASMRVRILFVMCSPLCTV